MHIYIHLCVCMYTYIYVYIYIFADIYVYVFMYIYIYIYINMCVYLNKYIQNILDIIRRRHMLAHRTHIYSNICEISLCVWEYVRIYTCIYITYVTWLEEDECSHIGRTAFAQLYTYLYMCAYICIYTYMRCINTCMYIYTHTRTRICRGQVLTLWTHRRQIYTIMLYISTITYIFSYVCIYVYVLMCVRLHIHLYTYMYISYVWHDLQGTSARI